VPRLVTQITVIKYDRCVAVNNHTFSAKREYFEHEFKSHKSGFNTELKVYQTIIHSASFNYKKQHNNVHEADDVLVTVRLFIIYYALPCISSVQTGT